MGSNAHVEPDCTLFGSSLTCYTGKRFKRDTLTKASDVQDADEVGGGVEGEALVDPGHHVVKQAAVNGLRQGVPSVVRLLHFEGNSDQDTQG